MSEEFTQTILLVIYVIGILFLWGIIIWAGCYQHKRIKNLKNNKEREDFFFEKVNVNNRFKHRRSGMDIISSVFNLAWMLMLLIFVCFVMVNPSVGLRNLWQGTGKFVDGLPAEMFAGLSIVAIITALVGVKKGTWFGFDIYDILREFAIVKKIGICLGLTFCCRILIFIAPIMFNLFGYEVYFVVRGLVLFGFFVYLYYLIKIMQIVIEILFGNNIDRFCANNLYRFLRIEKKCKRDYGEEELTNVMEYLLDEYVYIMEKIGCKELVAISYDTNINPKGERFRQKRIWSSIVIAGMMMVITLYITLVLYPEVSKWSFQWVIVAITLLLFAILGRVNYGFGGLFVTICYGWVSYRFEYKKKKVYSRETAPFKKRKYVKCVRSVENILALYRILLEQKVKEMEKVLEKYVLNEMAARDGMEKDFMKMLLISMDYMQYCRKSTTIKEFIFPKDDKCIQWAKGFAIKATNSVLGDKVDEEKFNRYLESKQKNGSKK